VINMKKNISRTRMACWKLIAGGSLIIFCVSGCMKSDITNISSEGKYIICFGDSITEGFGAGPKDAYPSCLSRLTSVPVVNAGIEGDTSDGALRRINPDVLDREPLLVIVQFGANDFLTKVPIEETKANLEAIIIQIQKHGAIVALADVSNEHVMAQYGPMFKALSRKYKTIYIRDLLAGIFANPSLKSDYFHPNAGGYKIIAQRIHRAILPHLNQNALMRKFRK
jgi:acyl-CoA thioesterase I